MLKYITLDIVTTKNIPDAMDMMRATVTPTANTNIEMTINLNPSVSAL